MRIGRGLHIALVAVVMVVLGTHVSAAPQPGQVHFTAVGDIAQTADSGAVLDAIDGLDSDFTLALGDLSYGAAGQEQAWCDFVTSRVGEGYPFELVAGNHESNGLNGNINDFSACLPNQLPGVIGTYGRQYYVDVPAQNPILRFIMISPSLTFPDGNYAYPAGSARYAWTEQAIDGARANAIPWVVVGMHKPCISVGRYACDPGADIFNLMVSKKVDLVLSGHDHTYQRSVQLAHAPGCAAITPGSFDADCVADSDNALTQGAGTVAMVVATGGRALYDVSAGDTEAGYFAAYAGANSNPSYGVLDVTVTDEVLQASFAGIAGSTFSDSFTINKNTDPSNTPPVAEFTHVVTDLSVAFTDTSTDTDGTVDSWAWTFGDGTTSTEQNPTHAYATADTFTVELTVTDNDGDTHAITHEVATADPQGGGGAFAADTFNRTVADGGGNADTGGSWTSPGSDSNLSVAGGTGNLLVSPGRKQAIFLGSATAPSSDLRLSVGFDKAPSGGGVQFTAFGRRVSGEGGYGARVKCYRSGSVNLELIREPGSGSDVRILPSAVTGLDYAVGDRINVRTQVLDTSPATIRAKVWEEGTAEPATWLRSVTDDTAGLQAPGSVGVSTYVSSSAAEPIATEIDDLLLTAP